MGKKEYERQGHYRTSVNGNVHWVRSHSVISEDLILSQVGSAFFVNGSKIEERRCQYCYKAVYFYQNEHGSRVFFDRLGEPWPKHICYHGTKEADARGKAKSVKTKKAPFVDPLVLEMRRRELEEKIEKREKQRKEKRGRGRQKTSKLVSTLKKNSSKRKPKQPPSERELAMLEAENKARARWRKWRETANPVVVIKKSRQDDEEND